VSQEIIVDTSALIAFFVRSETHHQSAQQYCLKNPRTRWIILESIFDETVTWIWTKISGKASIQVGQILREEHRYLNLSDVDDAETWEVFCKYNDKKWSYTDFSILVMANRLQVFEVFAFDNHIRQMAGLGIICVPQ
jgi:predicted nucleic acid-binding protein